MSSTPSKTTEPLPLLPPHPPPPTGLARYRLLSPRAGVHVSPIQLGGLSIGDQWNDIGLGSMDKEASFKLLDAYYDAGGNFIDIANNYQDGSSEVYIGEWAEKRGIRDRLFLTTKASHPPIPYKLGAKSDTFFMHPLTVHEQLHGARQECPRPQNLLRWKQCQISSSVISGFAQEASDGLRRSFGISDTPAWVVAKANAYARANSLTPFVIYQGHWNLMERSFERDIIPMARSEGLALAPWNVLASGKFRSDAEEARRLESGEKGRTLLGARWLRNEQEKKVCAALEKVANEVGTQHITAVAIAYLMHKAPFVFPIVGGRKVEHLHANLEALDISLSDEQIQYLESVVPFDPGFPNNMIGDGSTHRDVWKASGHISETPLLRPIVHGDAHDRK
ncbi:hypothetical protein CVT24_008023 [Panaeolus cyanescens]|uniref:NADP-dependent oxidoreductase domain-containing protein n=1 Tax=Panaeolus cyanescens TaxID=181874 RepID=A0A409YQZ6_9AGAR|nr:hypothetical protein CVT24_008023 [Panaeolus cyanescens]